MDRFVLVVGIVTACLVLAGAMNVIAVAFLRRFRAARLERRASLGTADELLPREQLRHFDNVLLASPACGAEARAVHSTLDPRRVTCPECLTWLGRPRLSGAVGARVAEGRDARGRASPGVCAPGSGERSGTSSRAHRSSRIVPS